MSTTTPRLTEGELGKLPLRALVALMVRATRRARPLFDLPGSHPNRAEWMNAVDDALGIAARYARREDLPEDAQERVGKALGAAGEADERMFGVPATAAGFAGLAAVDATTGTEWRVLISAERYVNVLPAKMALVLQDYEKLLSLSLGQFPEPGEPVDPSEAGPMGPLE